MTDISKGVALLDEMRPGWEERVSRKRLDMASSCDCVLGCVYGDYHAGLVPLRIDYYGAELNQAALLGFTIGEEVPDALVSRAWAELEAAWKSEIEARTR